MESKYAGYMGHVLMVDLTTETVSEYPWDDCQRELYLGGKMMALRILCDHLTGSETAFSEENWIVISTGPLTGTGAPGSSRFNISGLSPQTGIPAFSNCGGSFGFYLKKAGYDALILKGKCSSHKWLEIREDQIYFHDADLLWGMKTGQCRETLSQLTGTKALGKLCIGPAGEHLVKYAGIISDERSAGRTGLGAVLGWKNLKAITVTGNKTVPIYNNEKTTQLCKKWVTYLQKHPITGNPLSGEGCTGLYEIFENENAQHAPEKIHITGKRCITCPIRCAKNFQIRGTFMKGPELETLGLLGDTLCVNDFQTILNWNHQMEELGLDTISTARTIIRAMEAKQNGLGVSGFTFGNAETLSSLLDDIAYRRGIGEELAEGCTGLSHKHGRKEFAVQGKDMDQADHASENSALQNLIRRISKWAGGHLNSGYLTAGVNSGSIRIPPDPEIQTDFTIFFENLTEAISASGQCLFLYYSFFPSFLITQPNSILVRTLNKLAPHLGGAVRLINKYPRIAALHLPMIHPTKMIRLATGMDMDLGKYLQIGQRGCTLERYLQCRFGVTAASDKLPKRLSKVLRNSENANAGISREMLKAIYYDARGWDQNGIPAKTTLQRLKIE